MIIGEYPCCDAPLCFEAEGYGKFVSEDCPHCGVKVWHRLSRFEPKSWTELNFLEDYIIDHESKTITKREIEP